MLQEFSQGGGKDEDTVRNSETYRIGTPAHLVTLNRDGSPQLTLIWIGLDGDDIVAGHLPENRKVKNIRRVPRVAISLQANTKTPRALPNTLCFTGRLISKKAERPSDFRGSAAVYIGAGVKFPPMDNPPPGFITRIESSELKVSVHGQDDPFKTINQEGSF